MGMLNTHQVVAVINEFKQFCPNRQNMEDAIIQVQMSLVMDDVRRTVGRAMDVAWEDEWSGGPVVKRKVER